MSERTERVAEAIRAVVSEILVRQEVKDPRVAEAGLITVTHVRVSGDLRESWVRFTVHDADEAKLEETRRGLDSAAGTMRRTLGTRLRLKVTPALRFEVDRVFEREEKIDTLLREVSRPDEPKAR